MVDVSQPITANTHISKNAPHARLPYMIEIQVTAEKLIAAKGSAIAAADVYDLVKFPPQTVILGAWLKKASVFEGTSTDITVDVGVTGGDVDVWVDGFAIDDAAVGAFGPAGVGVTVAGPNGTNTVQTISMLIATMTGSWTGGELRLYVQALDLSDEPHAGIAQLYT